MKILLTWTQTSYCRGSVRERISKSLRGLINHSECLGPGRTGDNSAVCSSFCSVPISAESPVVEGDGEESPLTVFLRLSSLTAKEELAVSLSEALSIVSIPQSEPTTGQCVYKHFGHPQVTLCTRLSHEFPLPFQVATSILVHTYTSSPTWKCLGFAWTPCPHICRSCVCHAFLLRSGCKVSKCDCKRRPYINSAGETLVSQKNRHPQFMAPPFQQS